MDREKLLPYTRLTAAFLNRSEQLFLLQFLVFSLDRIIGTGMIVIQSETSFKMGLDR